MKENQVSVSIITPSFNHAQFIESTLLSVLNQDYPYIEHIVIDGGSKDGTVEILKKYESMYNLKWISEKDSGQSNAVNKGFKLCKGDIICWLNSDDVFVSPDVISYFVKAFNYFKNIDILYGDCACIDRDNVLLKFRYSPEYNSNRLYRIDFITEPSTFIKRNIIEKNLLDESIDLPMDYEYWMRLDNIGYKFKHVDKITSAMRIHRNMKTRSRWSEMKNETKKIQLNYKNFTYKNSFLLILDNLLFAFLKILAIKSVIYYTLNKNNIKIAFPIKYDSAYKLLLRQIFYI